MSFVLAIESFDRLQPVRRQLRTTPDLENPAADICFSSLDDLISGQSDRLAALQTHNQGLLQQLLPSPEKVGA